MTGGLQEQVTDGENWFGVGLEPTSKCVIGSQDIPYIYEDRLNKEDFLNALEKIYNMSAEERTKLGMLGRAHVENKYNFKKYTERWDELLKDIHKRYGSWENKTARETWELKEV